MRKVLSFLAVTVIVIGVSPVFAAKKATTYNFVGLLTAVSVDGDAATPDTFTFSFIKANGAGTRWHNAHEGDVAVSIVEATVFAPAYGDVGSVASDYEIGDGVRVSARRNAAGGLDAKTVKMMLLEISGWLVAYDGDLGVFEIQWDKANAIAKAWLEANGNPNPVFADQTDDTTITREGDGDPQPGDLITLAGRTSDDGLGLDAIRVSLAPAEGAEEPEPEPAPSSEPSPPQDGNPDGRSGRRGGVQLCVGFCA